MGVALIGPVASGLPDLEWPDLHLTKSATSPGSAAGLALVLFTSGMLTARSFAERNGYDIDVDREFAAFGMANIASALSQGFAVTGADSRTAVNDANGGRTQMVSIVAALAISLLLLVGTDSLAWLPIPALGVVLLFASWSLLDLQVFRRYHQVERAAVLLGAITMLGVLAFGAIKAIMLAVTLALLMFIRASRARHAKNWSMFAAGPAFTTASCFPTRRRSTACSCCASVVRWSSSMPIISAAKCIGRSPARQAPVERVVLDMIP
jgi:MFS superfamily sulfate permease-like transporter